MLSIRNLRYRWNSFWYPDPVVCPGGHANSGGKYCRQCGAKLVKGRAERCQNCGIPISSLSRFCPHCHCVRG